VILRVPDSTVLPPVYFWASVKMKRPGPRWMKAPAPVMLVPE